MPSAQTSSYPNSGSLTLVNLRAANTQIQGVFEPRTLDPSQRRRVRQNPTPRAAQWEPVAPVFTASAEAKKSKQKQNSEKEIKSSQVDSYGRFLHQASDFQLLICGCSVLRERLCPAAVPPKGKATANLPTFSSLCV